MSRRKETWKLVSLTSALRKIHMSPIDPRHPGLMVVTIRAYLKRDLGRLVFASLTPEEAEVLATALKDQARAAREYNDSREIRRV